MGVPVIDIFHKFPFQEKGTRGIERAAKRPPHDGVGEPAAEGVDVGLRSKLLDFVDHLPGDKIVRVEGQDPGSDDLCQAKIALAREGVERAMVDDDRGVRGAMR